MAGIAIDKPLPPYSIKSKNRKGARKKYELGQRMLQSYLKKYEISLEELTRNGKARIFFERCGGTPCLSIYIPDPNRADLAIKSCTFLSYYADMELRFELPPKDIYQKLFGGDEDER